MIDENGEEVAALFDGVELFDLFVDVGGEVLGVGRHFEFPPLASFVGRLEGNVPLFLAILGSDVRDAQFDRLEEAEAFGAALDHGTQESLTCINPGINFINRSVSRRRRRRIKKRRRRRRSVSMDMIEMSSYPAYIFMNANIDIIDINVKGSSTIEIRIGGREGGREEWSECE